MPSSSEVAASLIDDFSPDRSLLLDDALIQTLRELGLEEYDALEWLTERRTFEVLEYFARVQPETLPFEVSVRRPERLIGKARARSTDREAVVSLRGRLEVIEPLRGLLATLDDTDFEHLCAAILLRVGASEVGVTMPGDDGGIDFFGRIPVLLGDPNVPPGLVRTTLEARPLLVLGQAKRYAGSVDRPELQKFAGQVRDCIGQYSDMQRPPSHCVPRSFYQKDETSLALFLTTGKFTSGARDYARSVNMLVGDGRLLAELLVLWDVVADGGPPEARAVLTWMRDLEEHILIASTRNP